MIAFDLIWTSLSPPNSSHAALPISRSLAFASALVYRDFIADRHEVHLQALVQDLDS